MKDQTDIGYKDPDLQAIESFRSYVLGGEDQYVRNVGFEGLEAAVEKTEEAKVISNIILTALKTKENLTEEDRYGIPSEKRGGDILRLIDLLDEASGKECFLKASKVAEGCIKEAIVNTEDVSIDPVIWEILEELSNRESEKPLSKEGTRGEQFIQNILKNKLPKEVYYHIIKDLPKKEFFYKRPQFILSVFKQILENMDCRKENYLVEEKSFMKELTKSDLLFSNPGLARQVISILLENGLVKAIEVNYSQLYKEDH